MGAGAFKAETFNPTTRAKITSSVSSLTPPVDDVPFLDASDDTPWEKLIAVDTDDAVTALVRRELMSIQAKQDIVQADIDRHFRGLQEAQARKAGLMAQAQKYASFLADRTKS